MNLFLQFDICKGPSQNGIHIGVFKSHDWEGCFDSTLSFGDILNILQPSFIDGLRCKGKMVVIFINQKLRTLPRLYKKILRLATTICKKAITLFNASGETVDQSTGKSSKCNSTRNIIWTPNTNCAKFWKYL